MNKLGFYTIGLFAIIGFISGCCSWNYSKEDFEFTQKELNLMGGYKVGDIIYFESNLDNMDTITVIEFLEEKHEGSTCFISRGPSNYKAIKVKYLPNDKWAGTSQSEGKEKKTTYQSIISVKKDPLEQKTDYSIRFKGFTTLGNAL